MSTPDIAVLVSTFQRPAFLRRALLSIAMQQGVDGRMELLVTDDGSTDETQRVVEQFARSVRFPVTFTTHPHAKFHLARCRNEGVAASRAPYLLFLDGDCVLPPDHVRIHLERRRAGWVTAGDCCRFDQATSTRVTDDVIRSGEFQTWAAPQERRRLRKLAWKSQVYRWLRHPELPKVIGNNVGLFRSDYEQVNGYDENFSGWGCEDDDLRLRLRRAGVRVQTILPWTRSYHLWHPADPSMPRRWRDGANVAYLLRRGRLTRCRNGLHKRSAADLAVSVVGQWDGKLAGSSLFSGRFSAQSERPDVEIVVWPSGRRFSGRADCNLLVALEDGPELSRLARSADVFVGAGACPHLPRDRQFGLHEFNAALRAVA